MNNQEILNNAPEVKNNAGAMLYYSPISEQYYEEHDGYWYEVDDYTMTKIIAPTTFVRALSDIKRIVELEKGYEKLRIAVSNAIPFMSGSAEEYADFRDAYDEATKQLKAKGGAD
jgi:flagellar motor protein MotB